MKIHLVFLFFFFLIISTAYFPIKNVISQESKTLCFDDKNILDQAPTIASYDIIIPFTNKNQTTFEPMEVNLPVNTQVRLINLDNNQHHIIISTSNNNISNTSNSENPLVEKVVSLGDLITYNFTNPGVYEFFDKNYPDLKGNVVVGDAIQRGDNLSMTSGVNLPINTTELQRIVFLIEPNIEKTNIIFPDDLPLTYNFTINNPYGYPIYNKKIIDADGKLFFELIPQPAPLYVNSFLNSSMLSNAGIISNITKAGSFIDFITWGFAEKLEQKQQQEKGEQAINCLKGTLHIKGPVLVDIIKNGIKLDKPYSLKIDILATNENNKLSKSISDTFIIPNK
jgi:plastocyanin